MEHLAIDPTPPPPERPELPDGAPPRWPPWYAGVGFLVALVATQIAMAHGLGLGVVAEGVETQAQLEYLRNAGCGQVQGYLIARPLPPLDVRTVLFGLGEWRPQVGVPRTSHLVGNSL